MSERRALFGPNKANNLSFLIKGSVEFGASGVGVRKRQRQLDLAAFYPFLLPLTPRGLLTPEDQLPFPSLCGKKRTLEKALKQIKMSGFLPLTLILGLF